MKLLALTPQLPYPPMQGTTLRNFYLLRELARRHEVSLLTFVHAEDSPALERATRLPADGLLASTPTTSQAAAEGRPTAALPGAPSAPGQTETTRAQPGAAPEQGIAALVGPAGALDAGTPLNAFCRAIRTVPAPPRRGLAQRALSSLTSPLPDMALRLPSAEFAEALRQWLAEEAFDVIQVEGIEMAAYGLQARREGARARLVFDDHNAEYVLQRSACRADARRPARWHAALYSFVQWQKLARYERAVMRAHDAVAAVSGSDARALQQIAPGLAVHVVPNGVDTQEFAPAGEPSFAPTLTSGAPRPADGAAASALGPADLVFTGKMDYRPNIDAVLWFADEILPRVRAQVPEARFVIVGQQPHARLAPLAARAGVRVTGWVADVKPYIAGAAVYVAPLRMGGGTRLKVLQAMAMARPIVSTTLGCDGLSIQSGREALLADTPADFAAAVLRLLRDPALGQALGAQARALAVARYDWRSIGPLMEACYAA